MSEASRTAVRLVRHPYISLLYLLVYTAAYTGLPGSLRPALGLLLVTKVRSEPCALKCRVPSALAAAPMQTFASALARISAEDPHNSDRRQT